MRLAALFAILAFDATPIALAATESEDSLQVLFQPPKAPGDSFSLTFAVPTGHLAAVLFLDTPTQDATTSSAAPTIVDLANGLFFPVPVAPGAATATLSGVVPATMTQEQLLASMVAMRVLVVDPATLNQWWSDPIALTASTPEAVAAVDDGDASAPAGASKSSLPTGLQSQSPGSSSQAMTSPQSGGGQSALSGGPPTGTSGTPNSGPNSNKGTGPMSVRFRKTDSTHFYDGSHDQPVPVQGSGH